MKIELSFELEMNITENLNNINGIIKAVHSYQNELGKNILIEILETIDQKACNAAVEQFPLRYRNKGYSNRQFRTPMGSINVRFTNLLIRGIITFSR